MTEENDHEAERLLEELESQTPEAERKRLFARAKELGLQVGKRTKTENLKAMIEQAEQPAPQDPPQDAPAPQDPPQGAPAPQDPPQDYTVRNAGRNRLRIRYHEIAPGESYTLTADDRGDEKLMKKVDRMVDLGVLTVGAD